MYSCYLCLRSVFVGHPLILQNLSAHTSCSEENWKVFSQFIRIRKMLSGLLGARLKLFVLQVDIGGGFHGGGSANSSYGGTVTTSDSTATFHSAATLPVCASVDPIDSTAPSYRVEHIIMGRVRGGYTSTYTRSIRLWSAIKSELIKAVYYWIMLEDSKREL